MLSWISKICCKLLHFMLKYSLTMHDVAYLIWPCHLMQRLFSWLLIYYISDDPKPCTQVLQLDVWTDLVFILWINLSYGVFVLLPVESLYQWWWSMLTILSRYKLSTWQSVIQLFLPNICPLLFLTFCLKKRCGLSFMYLLHGIGKFSCITSST
jgi:hypothetical protein